MNMVAAFRREAGFTLMETIVALVVFTAVVVAIQRGSAIGWRGIRLAQMDTGALALARAKLATAGIDSALSGDTEDSGDEPPYQWRLTTRQYNPPADVVMPPRMPAFWVTVSVSWRDRPVGPPRTIELQTLKIGALP